MDKSKLALFVAVLGLVVGGWAVVRPATILETRTQIEKAQVGAVSSPVINSRYLEVGGVRHWFGHDTIPGSGDTKVNVLCSMQAPAATSTLIAASFVPASATGTPMKVTFAASASETATTTLIGGARITFATSSLDVLVATTTGAFTGSLGGQRDTVFPPNWYLVVDAWQDTAAASNGVGITSTFNPGGSCQAEWIEER